MDDAISYVNVEDGAVAETLKIGGRIAEIVPDQEIEIGGKGLFVKMARVMSAMNRVKKNGINSFHGYAYATSEDVFDAVRHELSKNGIAFFAEIEGFDRETVPSKQPNKPDKTRTVARFRFTFADSETGETWSSIWIGEAMDDEDKGISKAATLATKYFLLKTFLIATGDEVDPDAGGSESGGRPANRRPANQTNQRPANQGSNGGAKSGGAKLDPDYKGIEPRAANDWDTFYIRTLPHYKLTRDDGKAILAEIGKNDAIEAYKLIRSRAGEVD